MDAKSAFEDYQDFAAPKLDTYEQAIYLYIFRHSRLQGLESVKIAFKSANRKLAFGVGAKNSKMAEGTCYEKLRSLESKGFVKVLGTDRDGTRLHLLLPREIDGLIPPPVIERVLTLEEMDFFEVPENRSLILKREDNQCFYCLRALTNDGYVIEHVISRPEGDNSYRNLVAACRQCNNRKGCTTVDDFIRSNYRLGYLSTSEFEARLLKLQLLKTGELKPICL